jgi:VRR-NUC domain
MRATAREHDIQAAIVGYIQAVCPRAVLWAVPNAARRHPSGHAGNAVPGLRKGVFDLSLILPDGRFAAIEVKAAGGKLSAEQYEFGIELAFRGVAFCVARSVEDVRDFLAQLDVPTREAAA